MSSINLLQLRSADQVDALRARSQVTDLIQYGTLLVRRQLTSLDELPQLHRTLIGEPLHELSGGCLQIRLPVYALGALDSRIPFAGRFIGLVTIR